MVRFARLIQRRGRVLGGPAACPSWRVGEADDDVAALGVGVDDAVGLCAHPMT
jgi:hypothetical protein